MSTGEFKSCHICAWRADCQKRFGKPDSFALHCPEYTRDVKIKEGATTQKEDVEGGEAVQHLEKQD